MTRHAVTIFVVMLIASLLSLEAPSPGLQSAGVEGFAPLASPDEFERVPAPPRPAPDPVGTSQFAADSPGDCRIAPPSSGTWAVHAGLPLTPMRTASDGVLEVTVLFADFPDAQASITTEESFDRNWPQAEQFLEELSYGQLDVRATPHHQWLRMGKPHDEYGYEDDVTYFEHRAQLVEVIGLADDAVDFTKADIVLVLNVPEVPEMNTNLAFTQTNQFAGIPAEGGTVSIVNAITRGFDRGAPSTDQLDAGEAIVAHEILHTMGLPDLYFYDGETYAETHRFVGNFDPMGAVGGAAGGNFFGQYSTYNGGEVMAWQRWQIDWIDNDQVTCATSIFPIDSLLTPLSAATGTKAMVAPLGPSKVLVVEARMKTGYDRDMLTDGVLVYTVDSSIVTGEGPIRVLGDHAGSWPNATGLLQPGDELIVDDYTVEVIKAKDGGFVVRLDGPATCDGKPVTINMRSNGGDGQGTSAADVILGTDRADVIDGAGGNDTICAGTGVDLVTGGAGNDVIFGDLGADIIRGNGGDDEIVGDVGDDRLFGGTGNDVIAGGFGDDLIGGFGGDDTIDAGAGNDTVFGGFGADTINAGTGDDEVHGLVGNDTIAGGPGNDKLFGDRGSDEISGGDGDDRIRGGNSSDVLRGDAGNDDISGGKADDQLFGGPGTDVCAGNKQTVGDFASFDCETIFGVP